MNYTQFIIDNLQYIIPGIISACFLVVNIIQAICSHDQSKLKDAICRIPEIIRNVETLFGQKSDEANPPLLSATITPALWSISKKATAESILESIYGVAFVKKHIQVLDDAIEDILNTPQKKGGSHDGISQENEER